jgi:hypothetical protein
MEEQPQKVYVNKPQLIVKLVDANTTACRWGRGTGKTKNIADWTVDRITKMPRCTTAIVGATYTHLLTKLAPGIVASWEAMGFREGIHYWFNSFPPKNRKIPKPLKPVLSPKYSIFWWNGSCTQFLSSDRGLSNGLDLDAIAFDEARFLDQGKVRETILTVRGNRTVFGGKYYHHSKLFCSDAPRSAKSQWFNNMAKQMDENVIKQIKLIAYFISTNQQEQLQTKSKTKQKQLQRLIDKWNKQLNELRTDALFFSMASTLDNAHVLGVDAIKGFRKLLTPTDYMTSVLNLDTPASPNSFYPLLNDEDHGYHSENEDYIEKLSGGMVDNKRKNSLWKSPKTYDTNKPLDIALDYNNAINSLVTGQDSGDVYRFINSFFTLGVDKEYLKDVVLEFCRFFKYHKNKEVHYYYDQTAIPKDASGRIVYKDEVIAILRQQGWTVVEHRIHQASTHNDRFYSWERLLSGQDERLPSFQFDLDDCQQWQISCENAGVKQTEKGFKKDKSTENKKDRNGNYLLPPEASTHLSEAGDTLMDGKFGKLLTQRATTFIDAIY